ncbi:hypothetical protein QQ045_000836 [Rhodiola kirilowii]
MDSRDAIHGRQPQPQPQSQQPTLPQGVMMGPFAFGQHFPNNAFVMGAPNSASNLMQNPNFLFNPMTAPMPFDAALVTHQQPQQQNQQQNGSPASGGSDAARAPAVSSGAEQVKRKRGRPRKIVPDGTSLALSSNSQGVSKAAVVSGQSEVGEVNAEGSQEKRQRGRPPGSGKKQMDALGGTCGVGFTPHVIAISAGENIVSKMVEFSQEGARTICILSANGAVHNVTLRRVAGGTISYEGQLEIISLSGSLCCVKSDGSQNNTVNLTVTLAGPDGRVVGGVVTRELIAATAIQIVAGSFIADKKKSNADIPTASPDPTPAPHMLSFGGSVPPDNSTQHDDGSDSSGDNSGGHRMNYGLAQPWTGAHGWA